ncbi:MAG: Fe(3+) ABC transporter substrate-binding protein [Candidatus Izemoplasmataceae bacterium]
MKKLLLLTIISVLLFTLSACQFGNTAEDDNVITVYSERHYETDRDLFDKFEEETGIRVNLVRDGADQLITKLENEGEDSPADLLIIADAGRLHRAKTKDLLQPVSSELLEENVPSNYRDVDGTWFGLTKRARVIVYHPDRVDASELSTYEALTDEKWEGRIVVRTSANIYNQSLMASFVEVMGEAGARNFAEGLVQNFARTPQGNDRDQAKALLEGVADIAIMNTYYMGLLKYSADAYEREVADTLEVFFPNQDTTGTHVNVSAAGVTKHAPNKEGAIALLEFLTSEEAQSVYANANYEYPVNESVEPHEYLASLGSFKAQDISLSLLGVNQALATTIMDEEGWE